MPRLVVVMSGTAGSTSAYPPTSAPTMIDSNGNLTINGQPFLLLQASGHAYNDWALGGYTEAQADAMIQIAVNGGCNCLLSPIDNAYPYSTPQYVGKKNSQVIPVKFPQLRWNGDDRHSVQTAPAVAAFLAPYIPNPAVILWCFASEPGSTSLLTNYNYIRAADPPRQVIGTQFIQGSWHAYEHMYSVTVFDGTPDTNHVMDEMLGSFGLSIPFMEYVQFSDLTKLWEYVLFFDRRVRGTTAPFPFSAPIASTGGAGTMTGTFRFLYTWVTGTMRGPDSLESYVSPVSAPLTLNGEQAALTGIAAGPAGTTKRNVYAYKDGVSPTGRYPTSGYNLVAVIGDNSTTSLVVNTDYPFYNGPVAGPGNDAGPGYPPPTKTYLDWMPAISTTFYAETSLDYNSATGNTVLPMNLDNCRRWYFLQAAMNCRAFDVLTVWNQRGLGSANDPVLAPMSLVSKIALTSVTGDTGTCELEGVLADGVSIYREAITLNGATPALSGQTYSKLTWVGAQSNTTGPITITQATGGANLVIRNPVHPSGNPSLTLSKGHGIYAAGPNGLPYGVLQLYNDTWTAISHVKSIEDAILAPGIWRRIAAVTPAFQSLNFAQSGGNPKGVYAAKKAVAGALYVIALNVDAVTGPDTPLAKPTGNLLNGNAAVTGISSTATWTAGMVVSGPGIPLGATIASVDSASQITLSAPATRTANGAPFYVALENPLTVASGLGPATIDVGQTINTVVRVAGETGSPSFVGSVITDEFAAMAVHVYKIT